MTQTRILRCPACDGPLDGALNIDGRTEARDWMPFQCTHCGEISTVEHTAPGGLRRSTPIDWSHWRADPVLSRLLDVAVKAGQHLKENPT